MSVARNPVAGTYETRNGPVRPLVRRNRVNSAGGHWFGLGLVIAAHIAAIGLFLQYGPARTALDDVLPIMVDLITPPKLEEPPPPPPPPSARPKPRVEPPKTIEPPPLIVAAPTPAPAPFVAPPAAQAPTIDVPEAPQTAAPPAPPAPPAPITPPNFNASYLRNDAPAYPPASRRLSEQGRVLMRVLVNADGTPGKVELRESSTYDRLDTAALEAVRRWKFVPAHQAGQPVAAWVLVPITFSLDR